MDLLLRRPWCSRWLCLLCLLAVDNAPAQTLVANAGQQLVFAGLRSVAGKGQINGIAADASGDIYLLLDQKDGVRILKVANDGGAVLAQVQVGAAGDAGVALALDPTGNVFIAGTSSSGQLAGTSGAAMSSATAGTTNSFVAKFDVNVNEQFLSFTGGTRIAATAVAASGDSVFVTGITYATDLPVTENAIEQVTAPGSFQNGFVERFSSDGSTLVYASYISGAEGDTTPNGIAVDALDDAWLVGSTSASGFPTIAAVVPTILSNPSGFLMRLTPVGDGIAFSTFVPGAGLTGVALDSTGQTLLTSGAVALGQFPVDTVTTVLVPTTYQVLLRMPLDGSAVESGTLIAPGLQSVVAAAYAGAAWVGGDFAAGTAAMLPQPALATIGSGYAVRVGAAGVDQTVRFGGLANEQQTYAGIPVNVNGLAVDGSGALLVGGAAEPTASSGLLGTETYDLPLRGNPTAAFPSAVADAEVSAASCSGSLCTGSAAYLAKVGVASESAGLTFSVSDAPFFTLRNLGAAPAQGLLVGSSSGTLSSNCPSTLPAGGECDGLLAGGTAGTLTASASGGASASEGFGAYPAQAPADPIVFYPKELDFGVQTAASPAGQETITISNLGASSVSFASGFVSSPEAAVVPFAEVSSDCALASTPGMKQLAAGASCHVVVGFTASADPVNDGFVAGEWTIGTRQAMLTGYSQAATLSVSATEVDFGTEIQHGLLLPRFLYLSNASSSAVSHAAVSLPAGSPFTVSDGCAASLPATSVCRMRVDYESSAAPSTDSVTLVLDEGLSVLLTGLTMPPATAGGSSANPSLSVAPSNITFGDAVAVTGISDTTQTVGITNSGASAFDLSIAMTGDFTDVSSCGSTLAAGASCAVAVQFTPSQPGVRQGLLTVTAGAGTTPAQTTLSGSGLPLLSGNNGTLTFGGIAVGQPLVQFYKVTQPFESLTVATSGPFRVTLVEDTGFGHGEPPSSDYVTSGTGTCHNCWVAVQFQPTAAGAQTGTLTFSSAAQGLPYVLVLSGSGVADSGVVVTPSVQDFGAVPVNSSTGQLLFTVTNAANPAAAITISGVSTTGDFAVAPAGNAGNCVGNLAYGASCSIGVAFAPTATGSRVGTLAVNSSAGVVSVALTGMGVVDPGIGISPLALTFANTGKADANSQTVILTNTGSAAVSVGAVSAGPINFASQSSCGSLATGTSCSIQVTFTTGAQPVAGTLSIPVSSTTSSGVTQQAVYTVALAGTYTSGQIGLTILPGTVSFGPTATLTQGPSRVFSISNSTGKALTLAINVPRNYSLSGSPCVALPVDGSCTVTLQFVPLTNGDLAGSLSVQAVASDGSATLNGVGYAEGFGVGTGALTLAGGLIVQGVYDFGQVAVGQAVSHTFQLSNQAASGSPAITVRRVTSPPPFLSTTTCADALAPGQSCSVTVTYAPVGQAAGSNNGEDAGTLTIESDAQSGPDLVNLTGRPGASQGAGSAPPLSSFSLTQNSLTFAATTVGDMSPTQTVSLTNTGNQQINVSAVTAPNDFSVQNGCATIAAGSTCSIAVASSPQSGGVHLAALSILSDASTSLEYVSLISVGTPSALVFSPSSLAFGSVRVGTSAVLPLQVTNSGSVPVTFTSVTTSGDFMVGGNCPTAAGALAPQASCTMQVSFSPTQAGTRTGLLSFATSASTSPLTVSLSGTGTQSQLVAQPASLGFGSVALGSSANLSITLTNNGSAAVTGLTLSASGAFAVTIPCAQPTLAVGASCTAQVTFSPTAAGPRNGTLTIVSSDPSSPLLVPLTGSGFANGGFTLTANGSSTASLSVTSGEFATFALLVSPTGSFSGNVALTCTPLASAPSASCALLPSLLLTSAGDASSTATVSTMQNALGVGRVRPFLLRGGDGVLLVFLLPGLAGMVRCRRASRRWIGRGWLALALFGAFALGGCGGGTSSSVQYTPSGTYQFDVTASSTSGVLISHAVTLNVVVTAR